MRRAIRILSFCALLMVGHAQAQAENAPAAQAQIQVKIRNEGPYWVGQQVVLAVTLLAPGYFDSSINFHLPEPAGVLLMPPNGHPVVGNTTLDDTLYVTQLYELRAWPMSAGEQRIPAFDVTFTYKKNPLDKTAQQATVTSQALRLNIQSPPGTEGMGTVISARKLVVQEQWQPEPGRDPVTTGTAYKRTIRFSAPDLPGMIFPPFPAGRIDGLGIYQKPQVQDHDEARGGFSGTRTDTITYLAKRPGQYTIPAVAFHWFDLDSQELKTENFPARTLNIIVNPNLHSGDGTTAQHGSASIAEKVKKNWQWAIYFLLVGVAVFLFSRNKTVRRKLCGLIKPFKAVHLQPLNPNKC